MRNAIRSTLQQALCAAFGAAAWLAPLASLNAQQPPPGAGDVLRDLGDKARAVPPPQAPPTLDVVPQAPRAVKPLPGFRIDVKGFRFSGLTVISESELQPLVARYAGPDRTFADLQAAAAAVTRHLRGRGYFVAQAYLPEQKIESGTITIAVLEGRLGGVRIEIDPNAPISREAVAPLFSRLAPGTVLHEDTLEHPLFVASDLRGVTVRSVVEPGAAAGTANLVVKVEPARRIDGTIEFDNYGSRFTGENRLGGSVNINSPLRRGDVLSFRGLVGVPGGGEDTDFGRIAYFTPVGSYGTRIGAAYLKLRYHLGTDAFAALDQTGTSSVASLFAVHPIKRSRRFNLFAQANFDVREFEDDRTAVGTTSDRRIKAGNFTLQGDWRDMRFGSAMNHFALGVTRGSLDIQTPLDFAADQAGRRTHGDYWKLNGSLTRVQGLTDAASVYVSYSFQLASKNLDGSEKVSLGGPYAVRAYAQGEGVSDEAQLFTAELRHALPRPAFVPGILIGALFYDVGHGRFFEDPLPTDTLTRRTLQGAGVGLTLTRPDDFFIRATLSWRLSGAPSSDPTDRRPRIYFQAVKQL